MIEMVTPAADEACCGGSAESVTVGKNVVTPAVVGVPLISPDEVFSSSPGGKVPGGTLHVSGGTPPEEAIEDAYAVPVKPLAIVVEVIESGGGGLIVTVKTGEATVKGGVPKSVALIVKLDVPVPLGVPIIVPTLFRVSPAGNLPVPTL
jgi:hypothetical protein